MIESDNKSTQLKKSTIRQHRWASISEKILCCDFCCCVSELLIIRSIQKNINRILPGEIYNIVVFKGSVAIPYVQFNQPNDLKKYFQKYYSPSVIGWFWRLYCSYWRDFNKKRNGINPIIKNRDTEGVYKILIRNHLLTFEDTFQKYFRVTPNIFHTILSRIRDDISTKPCNRVPHPISAEQKLCLTLRYFIFWETMLVDDKLVFY